MRKVIKHHIQGGTRESHPRVQDLLHPRLGKPRRGLQILDTRIGFPPPSLPQCGVRFYYFPTGARSIPKLCTSWEMLSYPMVSHPRVRQHFCTVILRQVYYDVTTLPIA